MELLHQKLKDLYKDKSKMDKDVRELQYDSYNKMGSI
jgi:hypothetical protein